MMTTSSYCSSSKRILAPFIAPKGVTHLLQGVTADAHRRHGTPLASLVKETPPFLADSRSARPHADGTLPTQMPERRRALALAAAVGLSLSHCAAAWAECAVQEFRGGASALGRRVPDRHMAGVRRGANRAAESGPVLREPVRAPDFTCLSLELAGAKPAAGGICSADRVRRKGGRPPKLTRSTESNEWADGWAEALAGRALTGVN